MLKGEKIQFNNEVEILNFGDNQPNPARSARCLAKKKKLVAVAQAGIYDMMN